MRCVFAEEIRDRRRQGERRTRQDWKKVVVWESSRLLAQEMSSYHREKVDRTGSFDHSCQKRAEKSKDCWMMQRAAICSRNTSGITFSLFLFALKSYQKVIKFDRASQVTIEFAKRNSLK